MTEAGAADQRGGALSGLRVVDLSALGPGPYCSMLLADHGADVIAVERPVVEGPDPSASFSRGKRSVVVDLRSDGGPEVVRRLADAADVLLESNRPGTLERRGLGPDVLLGRNPRLVYVRLTGWGQSGPFAHRAGHDINYLAIAGVLGLLGGRRPAPPLNLVGDFAGGSLFAVVGTLLALLERARTGRGQVVDASILDGALLLASAQLAEWNDGIWRGRGASILSGAAPFYGVYECADGRWFAIGAIEEKFHTVLLERFGLVADAGMDRFDPANWPHLRARIAAAIARRTRDEWELTFRDVDGCGDPVLEIEELAEHEHIASRSAVLTRADGAVEAAPAPRLAGWRPEVGARPDHRGCDTAAVLREIGYSEVEVRALADDGVIVL